MRRPSLKAPAGSARVFSSGGGALRCGVRDLRGAWPGVARAGAPSLGGKSPRARAGVGVGVGAGVWWGWVGRGGVAAGLGWAGLGLAGLGWAGLGWARPGRAGPGWAGLGWVGLGQVQANISTGDNGSGRDEQQKDQGRMGEYMYCMRRVNGLVQGRAIIVNAQFLILANVFVTCALDSELRE